MAWRIRRPRWVARNAHVITVPEPPRAETLTAAASVNTGAVVGARRGLIPQYQNWQRELWARYDDCGEFALAVNWRANMMSRIRLHAGRYEPGIDEPSLVDTGPAAQFVHQLFGDVGGQSNALSALSIFLDVPGEGWVVGESRAGGPQRWRTYSSDEIRRGTTGGSGGSGTEVIDDVRSVPGNVVWRPLDRDALIVRTWRPHRRLYHEPYSPARAALSAMNELDLVNRHIQAQYLSRLASAGLIILPDELTFPTRPEFQEEPDPFVAEWIATAKEAIATPGTAAAVVPIPMRVPAEYVDKVQHIDFTLKLDEKIIEKRDAAKRRLAGIMNVPTDLLFEAGSINHWGLWQLEESAVKTYITPDFELIANALTVGYLHPRMRAAGEDPTGWTIWYDASEIITQPDISSNVIKAYELLEVSGRAMRREIGLNEDDAPTDDELTDMILKRMAVNPTLAPTALEELTGYEVQPPEPTQPVAQAPGRPAEQTQGNGQPDKASGPPKTEEDPPRTPRNATEADRYAFSILQASSAHVIEFHLEGFRLKHPLLCQPHLFSCPFTHATYDGVTIRPGTYGDYECTLARTGEFVIGRRVFPSSETLIIDPPRRTNGVAVLT